MVSRMTNRHQKTIKHLAVNACLIPVCAVHGMSVTTVEGIGSTRTKLHPVQERIAKAHGSQCGFCTPGIVMSMYALLRTLPKPTMKDMEIAFQGNLCRCTGYRPILEGYKTFTKEFSCGMGEKCCKLNGKSTDKAVENGSNGTLSINKKKENGTIKNKSKTNDDIIEGLNLQNDPTDRTEKDNLFEQNEFSLFDPTQEPIFPPELALSDGLDTRSIVFHGKQVTWFRPINLDEILCIKHDHPGAKIIVGNTEVGVEVKFKHCRYPVLVMPNQIHEMTQIKVMENGVKFGAAVTLLDFHDTLKSLIDTLPEHETRLYKATIEMLHYFAGKQIRNVASIGGNIMTGSPISDMVPILTAAGIEWVSNYILQ